MNVIALEQNLRDAQERFAKASKAMRLIHKEGEREEYNISRTAHLVAERELAEAKGEEYAIPLDFPILSDTGAPLPFLIANDYKTFLIFCVQSHNQNKDGTYIIVPDLANIEADPMALVEFERCVSKKLGSPNEEVFQGHPLYGKGLDSYTAQIVRNSKWLTELEDISKVHERYDSNRWRSLKHFVFWFHDSTFECIAENYKVEISHETLAQILARVYNRMN